MKLWLPIVALILVYVAARTLARVAYHEGQVAAYQIRLEQCAQRYPRYRCQVELDAYNPESHR